MIVEKSGLSSSDLFKTIGPGPPPFPYPTPWFVEAGSFHLILRLYPPNCVSFSNEDTEGVVNGTLLLKLS